VRKTLIAILIALALVVIPVGSAFGADVTVTATPSYVTLNNTPITWDVGNAGTKILPNTTYYSNPLGGTTPPSATVLDGECHFTADTTGSTVNTTLTVTWGTFTGGGCDMTNSDTGSNGATTYGAYCWYSGMTYTNKVVVKSTGSDAMKSAHAPGSVKWGVEIKTRTNDWTSGTASTSTLTITATAE
jgi:hypothetical protein